MTGILSQPPFLIYFTFSISFKGDRGLERTHWSSLHTLWLSTCFCPWSVAPSEAEGKITTCRDPALPHTLLSLCAWPRGTLSEISQTLTDLVLDVSQMLLLLWLFQQLRAQAPWAFSQQNPQFGHAPSSEHPSRRSPPNASLVTRLMR